MQSDVTKLGLSMNIQGEAVNPLPHSHFFFIVLLVAPQNDCNDCYVGVPTCNVSNVNIMKSRGNLTLHSHLEFGHRKQCNFNDWPIKRKFF